MGARKDVARKIREVAVAIRQNSVADFKALSVLAKNLDDGKHTVKEAKQLAYVVARWNNVEIRDWTPMPAGRKA